MPKNWEVLFVWSYKQKVYFSRTTLSKSIGPMALKIPWTHLTCQPWCQIGRGFEAFTSLDRHTQTNPALVLWCGPYNQTGLSLCIAYVCQNVLSLLFLKWFKILRFFLFLFRYLYLCTFARVNYFGKTWVPWKYK